MSESEDLLRLGRKYAPKRTRDVDARALFREQSLKRAAVGALLAALILNVVWVSGSLLLDRFFPWFSVIQGFFIGRAVQHFGRGIEWPFFAVAALVAVAAAFSGSFLSALFLTGREFDTSALSLVSEISWHTISTFATREFGTVGTIYAGMAAVLAAFFARRRLDRSERIALRKFHDSGDGPAGPRVTD